MANLVIIKNVDIRLSKIFSYPHYSEEHHLSVVNELEALGVEGVVSGGSFKIDDLMILGKGCTGIVCFGILHGIKVAIKVRRVDSNRKSLLHEGRSLSAANSLGVGPKMLYCRENVLVMEYIDGDFISSWLKNSQNFKAVKVVIGELLGQGFDLDEGGIDHGELSDAKKHIMINKCGKPYIIDFETASIERKCRNLISIVGYLFFKKALEELLKPYLDWNKEKLRTLIKEYKTSPSRQIYERIVEHINVY